MAFLLLNVGAFRLLAKYMQKKGNVWYFRRRIPDDVKHLYPGKPVAIFRSLKTGDLRIAAKAANQLAQQQDAYWRQARSGVGTTTPEARKAGAELLRSYGLSPGQAAEYARNDTDPDNFLDELVYQSGSADGSIDAGSLPLNFKIAAELFYNQERKPVLSEVKEKHFILGKGPKADRALAQFNSAFNLFVELSGDKELDRYRRDDANKFAEALVNRGCAPATIERYVAQIAPVFGTGIREFEIPIANIFEKISIPAGDSLPLKRDSFSLEKIRAIQNRCREVDDERRWLISMLSDTGARLAEIAGLRIEDIKVDAQIPNIVIKFTSERRLKQAVSVRTVPLLGEALWAAKRIVETSQGLMAFPSYNVSGRQMLRVLQQLLRNGCAART